MTNDEKLVMLVREFAAWSCATTRRREIYYSMAKDGLWEIISLAQQIERERCTQIADAHASVEGIAQAVAAEIRGQA